MAEKFIEDFYQYAFTISRLRKVVEQIRCRNDFHAFHFLKSMLPDVQHLLEECVKDDYSETDILKENLTNMREMSDLIFLADMLENVAIPIMERWIQSWVNIAEQIDERHIIESTSSGFLTIKDILANRYLHSNNDPMDEARKIVERQYDYAKRSYRVLGCGLGYHIYQLYSVSQGAIPITVYESNSDMVEYAKKYGVLSWIPEQILRVSIIEDPNLFFQNIEDSEGLFFLVSYIDTVEDKEQRIGLLQSYHPWVYRHEAMHDVKINFYRNKDLGLPDIQKLDRSRIKKDMVVIGGGPSVDDNIEILRKWQGKKTLVAVGTIWKRLLIEGIKPDYVMIADPYETTLKQVEDVEDDSTPLLLCIQAYWKLARLYKGPIYTICIDCPGSGIAEYARENGLDVWFSGGSVTVFALEFAVRSFADRVFFVGVDLAFPEGKSHASGTPLQEQKDVTHLIPIQGVDGGTVYTDKIMMIYKDWVEGIVQETEGIEYYNMSRSGALIKGTKPFDVSYEN